MIGVLDKLAKPWLMYALIAAAVVIVGLAFMLEHCRADVAKAEKKAAETVAEHQTELARIRGEGQKAEKMARAKEQQMQAAKDEVEAKYLEAERARKIAADDLSAAGRMLNAAEARYLAERAKRAATDPAAACRADATAVPVLVELRREASDHAGEASTEADRIAGQLSGLQDYVLRTCLSP